jgi:hypothetical protein
MVPGVHGSCGIESWSSQDRRRRQGFPTAPEDLSITYRRRICEMIVLAAMDTRVIMMMVQTVQDRESNLHSEYGLFHGDEPIEKPQSVRNCCEDGLNARSEPDQIGTNTWIYHSYIAKIQREFCFNQIFSNEDRGSCVTTPSRS